MHAPLQAAAVAAVQKVAALVAAGLAQGTPLC